MKRLVAALCCLCLFTIFFFGCSKQSTAIPLPSSSSENDVRLRIMTTDKLLYDMTKYIVGDKHDVSYMFNNEDEIWNFDYSKDSLENIATFDMFIYSGAGYEPWVGSFINKLDKNKVNLVDASRGAKILTRDGTQLFIENGESKQVKDNPYYWMDVDKYKTALFNITFTIEQKDPKNKKIYESKFNECINNLKSLEERMKSLSSNLKDYVFVTSSDSLDYFIKYIGLKSVKIPDKYMNEESEKELMKVLDDKLSKTQNVYFLYNHDSELIVNADIIKKYMMKNCKICVSDNDMSYFDLMNSNCNRLENLLKQ